MRNLELAIFDVDGTLLDTSVGILESVKYTINKFELEMPEDNELRTFIGPPIQDSFAKTYKKLAPNIINELAKTFRDNYKNINLLKAVPYEGIYKLCDKITAMNVKIAIATYKRQDYAIKLLEYYGFNKYSKALYGADFDNKLKKRDIIEMAIRNSEINDLSKIVMIGDSYHDAIGATDIGINFIGVTYGFDFKTIEDVDRYNNIGAATSPLEIFDFL